MSYTDSPNSYRLPKDRAHLAWFALGVTAILLAAALIVVGFIVADRMVPSPREVPVPVAPDVPIADTE